MARSSAGASVGLSDVGLADPRRWTVVWPLYLNSGRSVSEGRRVPLRFSLERPSVADVAEACAALQLPFAVEADKAHCRDAHGGGGGGGRGRVRVQLFGAEHAPLSASVATKRQLLRRIGEIAPTLKMRALRVEVEKKREEKEMRELQQLLGGQAAASASASASSAAAAATASASAAAGPISAGSGSSSSSPSGTSTPTSAESGSGSAKKNNKEKKKRKK